MRAAYYERFGPAADVLVVGELPDPVPGPGEVRVKLASSGINPSDVKARAGIRGEFSFPRIVPHSDGAGVIDSVGTDVDPGRVGERVWVFNAAWQRAFGTAAEYVALPSAQAVTLPDHIDFAAGACIGIPARTALHAVICGGGVRGKTVLIAGGAGAVGHYAVQLAKIEGARQVIASVSGAEKAELARAAGADVIVNYRDEALVERCREITEGCGVERVLEVDFAANVTQDIALLAPDGDIVVYGSGKPEIAVPFLPAILGNVTLRFFILYNLNAGHSARIQTKLSALLADDALCHNVVQHVPLEDIVQAHELIEQGQLKGNLVLDI
jgi:NADPH2:quinone reductase